MINFTRYNNSKATWPIPVCLQASLSLNSSDGEIKTFAEQRFFLTFSAFILKHRTKQQFINNPSIHRLHESDFEQNTLINRMTLFFSDNSIAFAFTDVSTKKKRQIADFYSVFNEYSSPQSLSARCSLHA